MHNVICLPFSIPDVYGGLAEVRGLLKADDQTLTLDFETKDSVLELFRLDTKVICVPLAQVTAFEFKEGWFTRRITIRANSLEALRQVPGARGAEVRLKVRRENVEIARECVSRIQMVLANLSVKNLLAAVERRADAVGDRQQLP